MHENTIKSFIDENIRIIKKETTLCELCETIYKEKAAVFVVMDENDEIAGVLNYNKLLFNILKDFSKKNGNVLDKKISNFTNKKFFTASPEDNLEETFDLMIKNKIENMIIVNEKRYPIGFVNIYDLYESSIKLKIRRIGLNISLIEEKSSVEKDNVIRNLMKEIDTLNSQSTMDPLTGLYNVRFFNKVIKEEADRAIRYDYSVSIIFMDLDHFKNVNDIYGHDCGNVILREIGNLLNNTSDKLNILRKSDIAVRYGGEEFIIICPNTKKEQAYILGERIRKTIEKKKFYYEKKYINITISIGISEYKPSGNKVISDTIKESDAAMYEAKNRGRNKVVTY